LRRELPVLFDERNCQAWLCGLEVHGGRQAYQSGADDYYVCFLPGHCGSTADNSPIASD